MHTTVPEQSGMSTPGLKRLDDLFLRYIDRGKLAGVSAVVAREGHLVYSAQHGYADIDTLKPLTEETIFRIASMTKPVTSLAAMMLYEEGYFHLNTPVREFIPGFKDLRVYLGESAGGIQTEALQGEITMRHLFTHTSGIVYGFNPQDPVDRLMITAREEYGQTHPDPDGAQVIAELLKLPLAFQPGTRWRYGMNIEVLGHIVEIISGSSLAEFMQKRIFGPLEMTDTAFYVPPEKAQRVSQVYAHPEGPDKLVKLDLEVETSLPRFQSGGGGLVSTLPDYARFCQMLVNQGELNGVRLLSPTTVAMYSVNQCPEQALPYGFSENDLYHAGYGFSLATRVLLDPTLTGMFGSTGEFGWDGAFGTYFWIDPVESLFGLMMIQHSPNAYYPIAQQFKQVTYSALIR